MRTVKYALAAFGLIFSQLAFAANTSIQNNESMATVRQKLNTNLNQQHNVRQPPYNAVGDGAVDDTNAIQSAMNDSCGDDNPVFIPAGTYRITSQLIVCDGLLVVGAGRRSAKLQGNFVGFIIGHFSTDPYGPCCITYGIESIGVKNTMNDWAAGGIAFDNANQGSWIRDCEIQAFTGIDAVANMFTATIDDCDISSAFIAGVPRTVGIYASQVLLKNMKLSLFETCLVMNATSGAIIDASCEGAGTGILLGIERPPIFTGSISGTTLTISQFNVGRSLTWWGQSGWDLACSVSCTAGTHINAQLTNTNPQGQTGREGTYTVNISQNVSSQRMSAGMNPLHAAGVTVNSFQTERTNTGIILNNVDHSVLSGLNLTGSVGTGIQVNTASWSGGVITYQLAVPSPSYTQGTHDCSFDGFANPNYNRGYHVTCNWSGSTVSIAAPDPGAWVNGFALVSPIQNRCLSVGGGLRVTVVGMNCNQSTIDGNAVEIVGALDHFLIINSSLSGITTIPSLKCVLHTLLGDRPTTAQPDLGMVYSNLPGQASQCSSTLAKGVIYWITDANTSTIGATVGGGGSQAGYVIWNGSAWTLLSK